MKITSLLYFTSVGIFAGCLQLPLACAADLTWNGGNSSWTDSGAWLQDGSSADWINGSTALFQTGSTLTVGSGISASGLLYQGVAVTLNGGSLTLAGNASGSNGGSATLSGTALTLNSANQEDRWTVRDTSLSGSSTLTKTGNGTVTLSGTHTANGTWNINAGTLVFTGTRAITGGGADQHCLRRGSGCQRRTPVPCRQLRLQLGAANHYLERRHAQTEPVRLQFRLAGMLAEQFLRP